MSYEDSEYSRNGAMPVALFTFVYAEGDAGVYRCTDAERDLVIDGLTYKSLPVGRGNYTASGTLDKATFELIVPRESTPAELFRVYPPTQTVVLTIKVLHLTDPDSQAMVVWTGRVLTAAFETNECKLACEPAITSLRRLGLRRNWQHGCPLALYGEQCGANKSARTVTGVVSAISGAVVTLQSGWNGIYATTKFAAGMMSWVANTGATETRTIIRVPNDTTVILSGVARGMVVGQEVSAILGCNHRLDDCESIHNNVANFGGQPWIPTSNPIGTSSIFY